MTNIYQNPLFSKLSILSFGEIVNLKNVLLVLNFLNNEVSEALQELLKNTNNQTITMQEQWITHYGLLSIKFKSAKAWNEIRTKISDKGNIGYWVKNRLSKFL